MPQPDPTYPDLCDCGRMDYAAALAQQRERCQAVIDAAAGPRVYLLEHDPVITLTRRKTIRDHILASDDQLNESGIATHETDRGGDITYHGPGQLVAYPILRLADYGLNLSSYMRLLEQTVIDTLSQWGIEGSREPGATGVWVAGVGLEALGLRPEHERKEASNFLDSKPQAAGLEPETAKIAALGVRIRKNVTMHGLALNVDPDMSHFGLIVPCGLAGRPVVSMRQLLGECCPSMDAVKQSLFAKLLENLERAATAPAPEKTR